MAAEQVITLLNAQLLISPVILRHHHHTSETRRVGDGFEKLALAKQVHKRTDALGVTLQNAVNNRLNDGLQSRSCLSEVSHDDLVVQGVVEGDAHIDIAFRPAARPAAMISLISAISWRMLSSRCHSSADAAIPGMSINS